MDCGGYCAPCNVTVSTLAPSDPLVACGDGVQDFGETGVDCGGACPPCVNSCANGVKDAGEYGVDCGGPCVSCDLKVVMPQLELSGPLMAFAGQNITYCVSSGGRGVPALISFVDENGNIVQLYTGTDGCINLFVNKSGLLNLTASQLGYYPVASTLSIWGIRISPALVVATSVFSVAVVGSLAALVFLVFLKPKGVVVPASSLKSLLDGDLAGVTGSIYITNRTARRIPELPSKKIKVIRLSDRESDDAARLVDEYGISLDDAESLILARKLKVKRVLVKNLPEGLKKRFKIADK